MKRFLNYIEGPYFSLVVALLLGAVALSGRTGIYLSYTALVFAWIFISVTIGEESVKIRWPVGVSSAIIFLMLAYFLPPKPELGKYEGTLVPGTGTAPTMPSTENLSSGAVAVIYGKNVSINSVFPHTLLRMGNDDIIVIDRDKKSGNIKVLSLRVFDDQYDIIARIDESDFWVKNTNRAKRPDEHTLIVYDHNDEQVLKIELLNPQTLEIQGIFRSPKLKSRYATITATEFRILPTIGPISGGLLISGSSTSNSAIDILIN